MEFMLSFFSQYSVHSSFLSIPLREFHVVDVMFSAYKPGDELQGNQLSVLLTKDGTLSIPGGYSRQGLLLTLLTVISLYLWGHVFSSIGNSLKKNNIRIAGQRTLFAT